MAINRKAGLKHLYDSFASGSVFKPTEQLDYTNDPISTSAETLDVALGIGGWARGCQHTVYGKPSAGKTALVLSAAARLQARNKQALVAIIDYENSVTEEWLLKFGLDLDRTIVFSPSTIEEATNMLQAAIKEGIFDLIVFDSLGAVSKAAEIDGTNGKAADANSKMYGGASLEITRMSNKVVSELNRLANIKRARIMVKKKEERDKLTDCVLPAVVFIGQARTDTDSKFAGQIKLGGGYAFYHNQKTVLILRWSNKAEETLKATIKDEKRVVGSRIYGKVEKNKLAPPKREASYQFVNTVCKEYPFGINSGDALIELCLLYGVLVKAGSYIRYKDKGEEGYVQEYRKDFASLLADNPEFEVVLHNQLTEVVREESKSAMADMTDEELAVLNEEDMDYEPEAE